MVDDARAQNSTLDGKQNAKKGTHATCVKTDNTVNMSMKEERSH